MIESLLAVGLGGSIGAICRGLLTSAIKSRTHGTFHWATFIINALACVAAGVFAYLSLNNVVGLMITMGFLGGFSTLSTLTFEAVEDIFAKRTLQGIGYLLLSYAMALVMAALGYAAAQAIIG